MPSKAETFSVRLPNEVKHQVDELARLTKRSRSFIVKEAVDCYMNNCAINAQELEEALKSAESSVGHSSEQTFAWMKSWGTENELPSPDPDILKINHFQR
jgi:predicted transcriptional regulator